jgi:hypothetical protein
VIALPAGMANAKVARPGTPAAHPRASTGAQSKSVKAGKSSARFHTQRSRVTVRKPKGSARKARKSKATTASGSSAAVGNPDAGRAQSDRAMARPAWFRPATSSKA